MPAVTRTFLLFVTVALISQATLHGQVCSGSNDIGFDAGVATINASRNCQNLFWCHIPTLDPVEYEILPPGCDPAIAQCTIRGVVPLEFPGNHNNTTSIGFFDSPAKLLWEDSQGNFVGACGNPGARIQVDEGDAWIQRAFSCGNLGGGDIYELQVTVCDEVSGCERNRSTMVDLTDAALTSVVCPPPPEETDCEEECGCIGTGGGGDGGGSASPAGGGASTGGRGTGPGVLFFYKAGGIGRPGQPGQAQWDHGRYWSHSYAQRIFEDGTDPDIVYLVTDHAVFRTWTDTNSDGTYDEVKPASDYRSLVKSGGTWTLTGLDGTVTAFNSTGRWQSTTDRNGNAVIATYTGTDLTSVAMPDGRREDFTYSGGQVATVAEVGVDGTTSRTWTYTWSGGDLTRIDRPDGTALAYRYDDPMNPGYLTRVTLVGMDGVSERVTAAFEYDTEGNVVKLWRGDVDFASGVGGWEFAFDNPALPTETTLTDPLGNPSTRTWALRQFKTEKPKLTETDGDCPVCGSGPNSQLSYGDGANPFKVTEEIDGRGHVTRYSYDANGRVTSRIEAFMTPLERETTWQYDALYPAFQTEMAEPSTAGLPDQRILSQTFNASGDRTSSTLDGVEDGAAFSYATTYTFNPGGRLMSMDPPGYGTVDETTFAYDPARGNGHLVPLSRTDPLIGTTIFDHDPFNRRTSTTDVNGVVTESTFDAANRILTTTQKGAVPAGDLVTEHRYSIFGDLFQTVLPEGNVIEYTYDAAGRLASIERKPDDQPSSHGERVVHTYDDVGNRVLEEHERWTGAVWEKRSQTASTYSTRCYIDTSTVGFGGDESTTEYAYDCDGNLDRMWDANHPSAGQTSPPSTEYSFDELDRLIEVRQPFGGAGGGTVVTAYAHDVQDNLIQVTDAEGTVTSYIYSDRGLLTQETSEVSGVTSHVYNEHGERTQTTDARGVVQGRTVDVLDRVTAIDYTDDSLDIAYTFDDPGVDFSIGRLTSIERNGHSVDYAYDRFGRTTQDGTLSYEYDRNSNRTRVGYPGGMAAVYTHDYADRQQTLDADLPAEGLQPIVTGASYEPAGPLAEAVLGNGLTETRDHDTRHHPAAITVGDGVTTVLDWQYSTDAVGNPTSIIDNLNAANSRTYGYLDYQYFLTQGDGPWGIRSWTYDPVGNRLTETRGATTDTYSYTPNAAMGNSPKLSQISLGGGGLRTFQYDAAGNQTQVDAAGNVIDRTYDQAGRMSRQERAASEASSDFTYDGRGFLRLASGRSPDTSGIGIFCDGFETGDTSAWTAGPGPCFLKEQTSPTYSSDGRLHGRDGDQVLYFASSPVAQHNADGSWLQLTPDHLGTPILATALAGSNEWQGGFEPFGGDYNSASAAGVFLRLPGQWNDSSWLESSEGAAAFYNLHRWYTASVGTYNRTDPARASRRRTPSSYDYVAANPLLYYDPLGLFKVDGSCDGCTHPTLGPRFSESRRNLTSLISREVSAWCSSRLGEIKNVALRKCIERSCTEGKIRCSQGKSGPFGLLDDTCSSPAFAGYSTGSGGLGHWLRRNGLKRRGRTAVLCANNPVLFDGKAGDTVVHEWAHGCGWNADRKPVPVGIPASDTAH